MTTSSPTSKPTRGLDQSVVHSALRVLALLTVLTVLFQGATAGEILMRSHQAKALHETGAVVLHVIAGLTMIAAAVLWRLSRGTVLTTLVAAVVFAASFVQAATGHGRTLYIHVPLALILLLGATWVLAWALLRPTGSRRT